MKTEIISRELLVVWIAYCLVFRANQEIYRDFLQNDAGVALRVHHMEHLVLSEERLWGVVKHVAVFLSKHHVLNRDMFSLRFSGATFEIGETISRSLFENIHREERKAAKARENKYWAEVQRKQQLVARLKRELRDLEDELKTAESHLESARYELRIAPRWVSFRRQEEVDNCEATVSQRQNEITRKKAEIKEAQAPPEPVQQPLPRDSSKAHQWLFFLHMPPSLRALATLSFMAQQMLVPKKCFLNHPGLVDQINRESLLDCLSRDLPNDSITGYYNEKQSSVYHTSPRRGKDGWVAIRGFSWLSDCRPKKIGPDNVEYISSPEDGTWYPDIWLPRMAWRGGPNEFDRLAGEKELDPFRMRREWTVSCFTEQLSRQHCGSANVMQWAIKQDGKPLSNRGNLPISQQDSRPGWLSKPEYLSFGKLRGFPYSQLRQVFVNLIDESLPLNDVSVHTLIFQALFQVGGIAIDENGDPSLLWKRDLGDRTFVQLAKTVFCHLVEGISETPSNYSRLSFLGKLCGFFSSFDPDIKQNSRRLARAASGWAEEVEKQVIVSNADGVASLRLKQSILLRHAILCCAYGAVDAEDARSIIKFTIRCRNLCLDDKANSDELIELESECLKAISGTTIKRMLDIVSRDHPEYITEGVQGIISQCPHHLIWQCLRGNNGEQTPCFEALADGCLYTVNVFTGEILVDGMPPSSLPNNILTHSLYQRTFGKANFEVVTRKGILETTRLISGRRYRFFTNGGNLHVEEVDENTGSKLELLDAMSIEDWGQELPVRLKRMHSHWFDRKRGFIVLRGIHFSERHASFILQVEKTS